MRHCELHDCGNTFAVAACDAKKYIFPTIEFFVSIIIPGIEIEAQRSTVFVAHAPAHKLKEKILVEADHKTA